MHLTSSQRLTQGPKSQATSPRSSSGNLRLSWNFFHPTFILLGTDLLSCVPPHAAGRKTGDGNHNYSDAWPNMLSTFYLLTSSSCCPSPNESFRGAGDNLEKISQFMLFWMNECQFLGCAVPFGCCVLEVFSKRYNSHPRVLGLHHYRDKHIACLPQAAGWALLPKASDSWDQAGRGTEHGQPSQQYFQQVSVS